MSNCDSLVAAVLAEQAEGWSCRPVTDDTLLLISPLHYSDGDAVEVMVKTSGDKVIVHDGGESIARLDAAGAGADQGRLRDAWARLLRAHAVEHDHGLVLRKAALSDVAQAVQEMVEALANIDGLRLLAPPPRALPFPDRIVGLLEAEFPDVKRRVKRKGASGIPYHLTAVAGHEKRKVYVQAASGSTAQSQRTAAEHAYTAFSDINGQLTSDHKLIVLDDEKLTWIPQQVKLLTRVAFVGTWTDRQRWINFIRGDVPNDSRLLIETDQLILE
ncbi:MAG: DUF1828 domain-containing protein [Acidobacteria bacterium]|nr:DUF1828 domain-containing protein [Acidobacteriota bacterium]